MPSLPQSLRRANARHGSNPEAGYILLAVLFLVALVLLTLAIAAPKMAQSIQRDRELELIHRGEQYKRAIKLYYAKFHAYPSSIDQLVNTNQVRFLRKRYTDPMTGKDDWKIIHFGEAHVKAMGLFGQPIATAGNPTAAGSGLLASGGPGGLTGAGGTGGVGTIGTGLGSITSTTPGGTDGSGSSSGAGSPGGTGSSGSTGGSSTDGSTTGGTSGLSSGGLSSGGLGSSTGNTNPTLGGGPMVGIAIPNTKASIKEYKQQKHYNEWEFVYDPAEDQLQAGTLFGGAAQNVNGQGTTNGIGGGVGGGLGGGIGTGSSGTGNSGPGSPTPQ